MKIKPEMLSTTLQALLYYSPHPLTYGKIKAELAVTNGDEAVLQKTLQELKDAGTVKEKADGTFKHADAPPPLYVSKLDGQRARNGHYKAVPDRWRSRDTPVKRPNFLVRKRRINAKGDLSQTHLLEVRDVRVDKGGRVTCLCDIHRSIKNEPGFTLKGVFSQAAGHEPTLQIHLGKREYALPVREAKGPFADGDYVIGRIDTTERQPNPAVSIEEFFAHPDMPAGQISRNQMMAEGFSPEYPDNVLREADVLAANPPALKPYTHDLRHLPVATVDGPYTEDFDDAIGAEPDPDRSNPGGYIVHVGIADVARFVRPGSAVDRHMRDHLFTNYLVESTFHLLPERLMQACSLEPGVQRYAIVWSFRLDRDGQLLDPAGNHLGEHGLLVDRHGHHVGKADLTQFCDVRRGIIRSRARLTYGAVDEHLSGAQSLDADAGSLVDHLAAADDLVANCLLLPGDDELRLNKPEYYPLIKDGKIAGIDVKDKTPARRLVEHYMRMVGTFNAKLLYEAESEGQDVHFIARVHKRRDDQVKFQKEKLEELLSNLPPAERPVLPEGDEWSAGEMSAILSQIGNDTVREAAQFHLFKMITPGEYRASVSLSPAENRHFGAGLHDGSIAHTTSPIRRYDDVINHRYLCYLLGLGEDNPNLAEKELNDIASDSNNKMIEQARMQRENVRLAAIAYLSANYQGKTVDAEIVEIRNGRVMARVADCPLPLQMNMPVDPEGKLKIDRHGNLRHTGVPDECNIGRTIKVIVDADPLRGHLDIRRVAREQKPAMSTFAKIRQNVWDITHGRAPIKKALHLQAEVLEATGKGLLLSVPEFGKSPVTLELPGSSRKEGANRIFNYELRKHFEAGQELFVDIEIDQKLNKPVRIVLSPERHAEPKQAPKEERRTVRSFAELGEALSVLSPNPA